VPDEAFLAPVERPLHLLCIGTNYRDHIAEMGISTNPGFPYAFLKPLTTIAPPAGPVMLPAVSSMVDWEAELGVVIGRRARQVAVETALEHVAGYMPVNDVSARDWVENRPNLGIDWVMQKGSDGFTPMGPWVTLARHVPDPQALAVKCLVNGEVMQDSSTANMLFSVAEIIAHVSRFMTLSPGDVIATGTPAGVGFGMKPRRFIADGDLVTVSVGSLGELNTRFVAEEAGHRANRFAA
jgi:2-keto-4-pentenoate hydratase/2-oxohepta-3-ene-1,7-dioic acid hydratase in catechol pathway